VFHAANVIAEIKLLVSDINYRVNEGAADSACQFARYLEAACPEIERIIVSPDYYPDGDWISLEFCLGDVGCELSFSDFGPQLLFLKRTEHLGSVLTKSNSLAKILNYISVYDASVSLHSMPANCEIEHKKL